MYTICNFYGQPVIYQDFPTREEAESAMGDLYDQGHINLRIVEEVRNPYPPGLTGESAHYACDGPRDQVIAELRRILDLCVDWGTPQAEILRDECREYLEDMGA
jgi:hypothetical protein